MTHLLVAEILGPDLLVILVIVGLLFGGARLPKLARSLGSARSEFEKGLREGSSPSPPPEQEQVTLTRSELDALIAEREARARRRGRDTEPAE